MHEVNAQRVHQVRHAGVKCRNHASDFVDVIGIFFGGFRVFDVILEGTFHRLLPPRRVATSNKHIKILVALENVNQMLSLQ